MRDVGLVERLRKRAEIRRQEGKPDRIADLLEEAANELDRVMEYRGPLHVVIGERDAALAQVAKLRGALEELCDGFGCSSRYGDGCDTFCKDIARTALAHLEETEPKP